MVQIATLKPARCELIFQGKVAELRKDEVLIVWKLDRLPCSLKDTLPLMERIQQLGAEADA